MPTEWRRVTVCADGMMQALLTCAGLMPTDRRRTLIAAKLQLAFAALAKGSHQAEESPDQQSSELTGLEAQLQNLAVHAFSIAEIGKVLGAIFGLLKRLPCLQLRKARPRRRRKNPASNLPLAWRDFIPGCHTREHQEGAHAFQDQ